jgi:exopolyphosphatase/guanosine-5'-triphosphate,3'-diphosphate pyrophosphatase
MSPTRTARPLAVLDIGTNSIKLLVATSDGTRVQTRHFARITTRLGEGLNRSGRISEAASARTLRAVRTLVLEARRHDAACILGVGTYALRAADNGAAVARAIERAGKIDVRVLTGRQEATLAFSAALARIPVQPPHAFLLDVGGGSAQFVAARGSKIVTARSLPLGALQLTERFLHHDPVDPAEVARMQRAIARTLGPVVGRVANRYPRAVFMTVGGSATTALAMAHPSRQKRRDGTLTRGALRTLERACRERSVAQRKQLPGLAPDRADIILAGIAVVLGCMIAARKRVVHVTGGGVREGVILAMRREEA